MTPPRVLAAAGVSAGGNPGKDVGASLRGASGTPPPTVCPGMGGGGSLPLIRPCGATFPQGGRQGLLLAAAQASAGRRGRRALRFARGNGWLPRLTLPTSPPAYSRCCRRQNRWGRSAHRPHARFRRWIRSRGASGHRRSGPEGTGVCCRCNFSSAG